MDFNAFVTSKRSLGSPMISCGLFKGMGIRKLQRQLMASVTKSWGGMTIQLKL
jgi:hypothetical protein